jgi:hypothetical protein
MKLVKIFSLLIVGLIITNVTLTNRAVDQSVTVSEYSREIENLDHSNTLLNAQIADLGSLTKLREGIEAAGFVSSPAVVSLGGTASVASR